jgi:SAM-dependent methyltransferase
MRSDRKQQIVRSLDSYNLQAGQWAERLRQGNNPAHRFLEKPAMFAKLGDIKGANALCIGCGSGEEVGMLLSRGARQVQGIDISEKLIQIARETYPQVSFAVRSMEDLQAFPDNSFDFVYSSLVLHYASDWSGILREVRRILVPGGRMLFSTHHPVKWGAEVTRDPEMDTFRMGYERPAGAPPSVFGDYLGSRLIADQWFGSMAVEYHHRPLEAIFKDVLSSGLTLLDFLEPKPTDEARTENPGFWEIHSRIPLFMIFELGKNTSIPGV